MSDPRQPPPHVSGSNHDGDEGAAPVAASYSDYLRLPDLLGLQQPLARPAVHDELLFIIVHQAHELWFKQILCELSLLISDIDARSFETACRTLDRMTRIAHLLYEHMRVLETMSLDEFQLFRSALGTASGIESEQFHRLEQLAGLSKEALPLALDAHPSALPSESVRQAFWRAIAAAQPDATLPDAGGADIATLGRALAEPLAQPGLVAERSLAEAMLVFDEHLVAWRREHFALAHAMLGGAAGTGGSSGAAYLRATMDRRFFPELWHWRQARGAVASPA